MLCLASFFEVSTIADGISWPDAEAGPASLPSAAGILQRSFALSSLVAGPAQGQIDPRQTFDRACPKL